MLASLASSRPVPPAQYGLAETWLASVAVVEYCCCLACGLVACYGPCDLSRPCPCLLPSEHLLMRLGLLDHRTESSSLSSCQALRRWRWLCRCRACCIARVLSLERSATSLQLLPSCDARCCCSAVSIAGFFSVSGCCLVLGCRTAALCWVLGAAAQLLRIELAGLFRLLQRCLAALLHMRASRLAKSLNRVHGAGVLFAQRQEVEAVLLA